MEIYRVPHEMKRYVVFHKISAKLDGYLLACFKWKMLHLHGLKCQLLHSYDEWKGRKLKGTHGLSESILI